MNLNFVCKMRKLEPLTTGTPDFNLRDHFAVTEHTAAPPMSVLGNTALIDPAGCWRVEYRGCQAEIRGQASPHTDAEEGLSVCSLPHGRAFPRASSRVRSVQREFPT